MNRDALGCPTAEVRLPTPSGHATEAGIIEAAFLAGIAGLIIGVLIGTFIR